MANPVPDDIDTKLRPLNDRAAGDCGTRPVTDQHRERLDAVLEIIRWTGARRVIDAGCGDGPLIAALSADPGIEQITGFEPDPAARRRLAATLGHMPAAQARKIEVEPLSILDTGPCHRGADLVALVEVIEHIDIRDHRRLEQALFGDLAAGWTVVTTPNAEYNPVLGVPAHRRRHPDHRFEWTRAQFRRWAEGAARRHAQSVAFADIVRPRPGIGGSSQMAVFRRAGRQASQTPLSR